MAKFCGKCGMKLDDTARVCGNCGTPLENTKHTPSKHMETKDSMKLRKKMKLVIVLVTLVTIVCIGLNIVSNFTGNKGLIRKVMKAYENYDIETIVSLSSDLYYYTPVGYESAEDYIEQYFERIIGNDLDFFEETIGHSYKLSYEINEIYELSERRYQEMLEEFKIMYPQFDVSLMNKIIVADLTITAIQGSNSQKINLKMTMTKEKNDWKLLDLE